MENNETNEVSFGRFGTSFQEKVMQALLSDRKWAEQTLEVMDVKYFDLNYLAYLADKYFSHAKRYKEFPTLQLLITIIRDDLKSNSDATLRTQIIDYLQRMRGNPDMGDLPFVKEKALEFARKQALKIALEKSVELIENDKYESVVDIIKNAVNVGTTPSVGHDLFNDIDARFLKMKRDCVGTGIEVLDKKGIFNGGLGKGEIGVICAASGVGKSHFLTMLGANALRQQKNVLHYTFELSEIITGIRYDSNLTEIVADDVLENKEAVQKFYKENQFGRLIIKEYPSNFASVFTVRSHIEKLSLKGFVPDLLIVDYADCMRSTRQYDSVRHELKLVYDELRSLGGELGIPIWTASQTNREASTIEIVDMNSMAEAYGKAMIADVILSISRLATEKATGCGRLYIAKNRAGKDGLVYPIKIDTSRSKFVITGSHMLPDEAKSENESEIKQALRDKWRELQKDETLPVRPLGVDS